MIDRDNIAKDEVNNYYSLNISDDSMAPNICPGDRVIIKQGPVEDGQVGAIICAGEKGVIRKINFASEPDVIVLTAFNPAYQPVIKHMADCRVLGAVILRFGPLVYK